MKELIAISAALCVVALTTMADTSGMSFWKNDDSSGNVPESDTTANAFICRQL